MLLGLLSQILTWKSDFGLFGLGFHDDGFVHISQKRAWTSSMLILNGIRQIQAFLGNPGKSGQTGRSSMLMERNCYYLFKR